MVMEAATLTSPQRKLLSVVPVQKSLSLPSYARAGGGGIDHRLIFAALEQKEKRRKSSIFAPREKKSTRQNIFCLPIPSSRHDKCRETSFSSDTSCSSLEYRKTDPKTKPNTKLDEPVKTKHDSIETATPELKPAEVRVTQSEVRSDIRRSPADSIARLNVCSSDSMERSSRSSTDSFSRKERLVAMKARVEAAREKYGQSSSEEESRSTMTRYNSDGSIHRSVREVKSRSSRSERRLRRRSQGEWSNQPTFGYAKINQKKNSNLSCNSEDGIHLSLERPTNFDTDLDHLDIKTDFCPSPSFSDMIKKNYFSDIPSRENSARFVQARIRHIEDEERKRRSGSDFRELRTPRHSPLSIENTSPASTERRYPFEKQNGSTSSFIDNNTSVMDVSRCSPLLRSSQAPTPPPRSPKSLTFMNKAFMQHHNASLRKKESSLDHNNCYQSNNSSLSRNEILERFNSKSETTCNGAKHLVDPINNPSEKQNIRELINNRRKTCGNFDFIDKKILDDLCSIKTSVDSSKSIVEANKKFSSVTQIRSTENKGYFSSTETPCGPVEEDLRSKLLKTKWQETDQRREYMFNSLESKRSNPPTWIKGSNNMVSCLCHVISDDNFKCICKCNQKERNISSYVPYIKQEICNPLPVDNQCSSIRTASNRLSKSEVNIARKEKDAKTSSTETNKKTSLITGENILIDMNDFENSPSEKISASANLESAMEELESVYRSLKISSDNLSDRNSISNASLSDDGSKAEKNNCIVKDYAIIKRRSSVCEGNWKSGLNTPFDICKNSAYKKSMELSSTSYPIPVSVNRTSEINQLSIDELFNNMTLQLDDLEQNIIKNPTSQLPKYTYKSNHLDSEFCKSKQSSQINQRKQFFDNLCKNNSNQNNCPTATNDSFNAGLNKKKNKAVRTLSENISYLMTSTDSVRDEINAKSFNESTRFDTASNADVTFKRPNLFTNTNKDSTQDHKRDEIRNIRVSMDSDLNQSKSMKSDLLQDSRKYPRLSSAVSSSHATSPKAQFLRGTSDQDATSHWNTVQDSRQYPGLSNDSLPKNEMPLEKSLQDMTPLSSSLQDSRKYPLLSSAAPYPQDSTSKLKVSSADISVRDATSCVPKDSVDVEGLEKLLNSLLGEGSERKQSNLMLAPSTPPPVSSGIFEDVKSDRTVFPLKMDVYVASKQKKNSSAECPLKSIKPEENAQKVNNFGQNNNAAVSQMSFIPVYTKKADMCRNFPSTLKDEKNPRKRVDSPEPTKTLFMYSPPSRQKGLPEPSEKPPVKTWSMHMRRRSVGFENMTSVTTRYGQNFTNEQRVQTGYMNSNVEPCSTVFPRNNTNSENNRSLATKTKTESENGSISRMNQNTQSSENENNHVPRPSKPSQYLKDKSSKRKSSLNRIDFVDFPTSTANIHAKASQQKNSSSDEEGSDSKSHTSKSEFLSTNSKRKHNISSSSPSLPKAADRKINEIPQTSPKTGKNRTCLLPRSHQKNQMKPRQHRRIHSAAAQLQKFSHSAGELESLTDPSETASTSYKICLSAQEFDTHEMPHSYSKVARRYSYVFLPATHPNHVSAEWRNNSESSSHRPPFTITDFPTNSPPGIEPSLESVLDEPPTERVHQCDAAEDTRPGLDINGELDLKHIDSRSEEDSDLAKSTSKLSHLDISGDCISSEDNADLSGSEGERCRGSILRKKFSEEKRELHGILKPPSEDNPSWTLPSILKHRESSEEKETWLQGDLHSILKKSTSEEESCNSGSDIIRPILKFQVSTDEDSPREGCSSSSRPRPILKKRTSFSEECFYASYPNGELKPILKKKIAAFDEQPRPILKSRRKSEDTKSFSEFVASRPRAYSADMGIKAPSNHESRLEGLSLEEPGRCRDHEL